MYQDYKHKDDAVNVFAKQLLDGILGEREEILRAFAAKYKVLNPECLTQIIKNSAEQTSWSIKAAHRVYIAGPMSNVVGFNYEAFNSKAKELSDLGFYVYNPAASFAGSTNFDYAEYIKEGLSLLLRANSIYLLNDWYTSKGALLETLAAYYMNYHVMTEVPEDKDQMPKLLIKGLLDYVLESGFLQKDA